MPPLREELREFKSWPIYATLHSLCPVFSKSRAHGCSSHISTNVHIHSDNGRPVLELTMLRSRTVTHIWTQLLLGSLSSEVTRPGVALYLNHLSAETCTFTGSTYISVSVRPICFSESSQRVKSYLIKLSFNCLK